MNRAYIKYILRAVTAIVLIIGIYFIIQPIERTEEKAERNGDANFNFVKAENFEKHYEQFVIFDGTITKTSRGKKVVLLKFNEKFQTKLTLVLFEKYYPIFPETPEKYYLNQKVRVTGFLKKYKGKPEIILYNPKQIEIIEQK